MVKCKRGTSVIQVTEGAFKTIFEPQGYVLLGDKPKKEYKAPTMSEVKKEEVKVEEPVEEQVDEVETEEVVEESVDEFAALLEKPIGQWSNNEVKGFAEAKGIDITGTKNAKEAKARIKKFLESAE